MRLPIPDGPIQLRWYAIKGTWGWLPAYDHNGRANVGWSARQYEQAEALRMAEARAREEAEHYTGDWEITIEARAL